MKILATEYGFRPQDKVAIYFKNNKWRIYEQSSYYFKSDKKWQELIGEVCQEKRVKPSQVKLCTVEFLILKEGA